MGLFNKIFGDSEPKDTSENAVKWNYLTDLDQLSDIAGESQSKPVIIFKHSTRCSISRMALKQFENQYSINAEKASPYFLDLLEYRPISNEIATRFDVVHQSPQILLIKDGKCIYTASHSDIDADDLANKIKAI
ncbi:MAG: bacillithiol system redox-active protein YtxJ [Flavobacterium sp.]|nr:bacillithiol system redox-active protein YtxJ [Flavobacterium sp.]